MFLQNKILHDRLEALHIKLADKEHSSSGFSSKSTDSKADDDIHNVVSFLRRSKEIVRYFLHVQLYNSEK